MHLWLWGKMSVKVGAKRSTPRPVNAGAPQGSVLGCFLFNVGIDDLEDHCQYDPTAEVEEPECITHNKDFPAASTPVRVSTRQPAMSMSPIREEKHNNQEYEFLPRAVNVHPWLRKPKDPTYKDSESASLKFVDDGIHMDVVNMRSEKLL